MSIFICPIYCQNYRVKSKGDPENVPELSAKYLGNIRSIVAPLELLLVISKGQFYLLEGERDR